MPSSELETSIPFRLHANAAEAQVHHLAWLEEMGLISDPGTAPHQRTSDKPCTRSLTSSFIRGSHDWSRIVDGHKKSTDSQGAQSYLLSCDYLSSV